MALHNYDLTGDPSSAAGMNRLKAAIEAYWAERGAAVTVTIAEESFDPSLRTARRVLRSDMVNGLPRALAEGRDPAATTRRPRARRLQDVQAVQP